MASKSPSYLDIFVDLPNGRRMRLSLPNKDVTVCEIVEGLITEKILDSNFKYKMSRMLHKDQKICEIVEGGNNIFVILEDQDGERIMPIDDRKVFVVHGHEIGLRDTVARFLEKLGATPVILADEPSIGKTVIEKLEKHSDVRYAVILMTADDRGGTKDISFKQQKMRARQNVIFELGYFLSKLGRSKVCVLYENGVEIPSDFTGVIYIPHDTSDGWKITLSKELQAAGLDIDVKRWLTS